VYYFYFAICKILASFGRGADFTKVLQSAFAFENPKSARKTLMT
jgi:hypothetical protein